MTNEELILKKLEDIEAKIEPMLAERQKWIELRQDLVPLQHQAVNLLTEHLKEVEVGFQLEDLFLLLKQTMRNTQNFLFALQAMDNIIEFVKDMEPLLKSAVPKMIEHLDDLEQKGVFRILKATLDVRAKVADAYDGKDIDQIGDGMVAMLKLAKKMSDPQTLAFLERAVEIPGSVDLSNTQKVGPFRMLSAGFNSDVKEGLGVLIELTKAMSKLKTNGQEQLPADTAAQ